MRYADHHCTYTESYEGGKHTYTFTGKCIQTGKLCSVTVPGEGLYKYRQGAFIQDAFPDLSKDDREFLMSGFSPEGWALAFPRRPDDDDLVMMNWLIEWRLWRKGGHDGTLP